jgi:hypothetical protein
LLGIFLKLNRRETLSRQTSPPLAALADYQDLLAF